MPGTRTKVSELHLSNLVYKNEGESISIKLKGPCFNKLSNIVKALYSSATSCESHPTGFIYELVNSVKNPVCTRVTTSEIVGSNPEVLSTLTLYPTTHTVHVQGTIDNNATFVITHLTPLIEVFNKITDEEIPNLKCMDCYNSLHQITSETPLRISINDVTFPNLDLPVISTPGSPANTSAQVDSPTKSVKISQERETSLIHQVLSRLQQTEDLVGQQNVQYNKLHNLYVQQTAQIDSLHSKNNSLAEKCKNLENKLNEFESSNFSNLISKISEELDHKISRLEKNYIEVVEYCEHVSDQLQVVYSKWETARKIPSQEESDASIINLSASSIDINTSHQLPPSPSRPTVPKLMELKPKISVMLGDSNLRRASEVVKNFTNEVILRPTSGATFVSTLGEVCEFKDNELDILFIQGGSNDVASQTNATNTIPDLVNLIETSKLKANRVILIPPPPTTPQMIAMETVMQTYAEHLNVECIAIHKHFYFNNSGREFFDNSILHPTKCGSGLYGLIIGRYLTYQTPLTTAPITPDNIICIKCHQPGHSRQYCNKNWSN